MSCDLRMYTQVLTKRFWTFESQAHDCDTCLGEIAWSAGAFFVLSISAQITRLQCIIMHDEMRKVKVKVKLSLNRPGQTVRLRLPEFLDNRHMNVARLSALRNGRLYSQEESLVRNSVGGWVRPEGLSQWYISMVPSGIEPSTILLVAQCLKLGGVEPKMVLWCQLISMTKYDMIKLNNKEFDIAMHLQDILRNVLRNRQYDLLTFTDKQWNA
jgi:hypothetical protein